MNCHKLISLGLLCLVAIPSLSTAAASGESVGRVIISTTNLIAKQTDGSTRALQNTSPIFEGDTIITGESGMAQLRLRDGSLFSLRNETEFQVAEFRFKLQQQANEGGLFNLLRGGFRTITGLLGKRPNSAYQVKTTAATIGIRGTHYGLRLCQNGDCIDDGIQQDGLYGGVIDGEIVAKNQYGSSSFSNDEYFFIQGWSSKSQGMLVPPGIVFDGEKIRKTSKRSQRKVSVNSKSGSTTQPEARKRAAQQVRKLIADTRQSGKKPDNRKQLKAAQPGTVAALAMLMDKPIAAKTPVVVANSNAIKKAGDAQILFTAEKHLGAAAWYDGKTTSYFKADTKAKLKDAGSLAKLGVSWGRWGKKWEASTQGTDSAVKNSSAHYLISNNVTTAATLAGMTGRPAGTFNIIIGGTQPTDQKGVAGKITNLSIGADFAKQQFTSYNLGLRFAGKETATLNMGPAPAVGFAAAANGAIALQGSCAGGKRCGADLLLTGSASVNFLGNNASAVMTSFSVTDTATAKVGYTGTAVVK